MGAEGAVTPTATFALFAYNQERYIREAIEGAFAQTYQPLEIILSDDCSSDRTFEIMSEMAGAYQGPHEVRTVRNKSTAGVLPHVLARGREAKGGIVVVAAGDDVSRPERTATSVARFNEDASIFCVSSAYDLIGVNSELIAGGEKVPLAMKGRKPVRTYLRPGPHPYSVIQGSTACYRRHVFEQAMPAAELIFSEDLFFNFLIYLLGGYAVQVDDPLVKYRQHPMALSNRGRPKLRVEDTETEGRSEARKRINMMEAFRSLAQRSDRVCEADMPGILVELERSRLVYEWPDLPLAGRVSSLIRFLVKLRVPEVKWQLLRLVGAFPRYQPKTFLSRLDPRFARR